MTKKLLFFVLLTASFLVVSKSSAYQIFNPAFPVTIRDNGRDFQAQLILAGVSSVVPTESEGSQSSHRGFNPYIGGAIQNYFDTNPATPAPNTLPDTSIPVGGSNQLLEFFTFSNIDAITIAGVQYISSQLIAQCPPCNFDRVVLGAVMAPPQGLTVVQGVNGAEMRGIEMFSNLQFPGAFTSGGQGSSILGSNLLSVDLDNNGFLETVFLVGPPAGAVTTAALVYALNADMTLRPGFPVSLANTPANSISAIFGIAAGRIDASGGNKIVVGMSMNNTNYAAIIIDQNGVTTSITPYTGLNPPATIFGAPPVLNDLDGDGIAEIIAAGIEGASSFGSQFFLGITNALGASLFGYPAQVLSNAGFTQGEFFMRVAIGNVDADAGQELVFMANGQTFTLPGNIVIGVIDIATASLQNSFVVTNPVNPLMTQVASPDTGILLENLDVDLELEIGVVGSTGGSGAGTARLIYVYNADGTLLAGWPVTIGQAMPVWDALFGGDVNNDGQRDIGDHISIFGGEPPGCGNCVLALQNTGSALPGFPVGQYQASDGIRAADIDYNGQLEILFGTGSFSFNFTSQAALFGLQSNGVPVNGFPIILSAVAPPGFGVQIRGPIVSDTNGDGILEAINLENIPFSNVITVSSYNLALNGGGAVNFPNGPVISHGHRLVDERNTNAVQ